MDAINQLEELTSDAPTITFEFGGLAVRVDGAHVARVLDQLILDRHTMAWGHTWHVHDPGSRAQAVDWLIDELTRIADLAGSDALTGIDGVDVFVSDTAA